MSVAPSHSPRPRCCCCSISFGTLLLWIQQQTSPLTPQPHFPAHTANSRSTTKEDRGGLRELCKASSSLCTFTAQRVASKWQRVYFLFLKKIGGSVGRDAYCIWSGRQGGCRRRCKRNNMDPGWTEDESQTHQQELWLLSATVGR